MPSSLYPRSIWAGAILPGRARGLNLPGHHGGRMRPGRLFDKSVFAREPLPKNLKAEIDRMAEGEAQKAAFFLPRTVGGCRSCLANNRLACGGTLPTWLPKPDTIPLEPCKSNRPVARTAPPVAAMKKSR
jgi:hypothetical protein